MKTIAACILLPLALLSLPACGGDSHEAAAEDMVASLQRMGDTMGEITDKASAEARLDEIKAIISEMKAIAERVKALGETTAEEEKAMAEIPGMQEATMKLMTESMRIGQNEEISKVLAEAMKDMQDFMR
ncbi:MAG: hypothetical protein ACYTG5_21245 [Planctomycetota bacterium]